MATPRFVTGLAMSLYVISMFLGVVLLAVSKFSLHIYYVPGALLLIGGFVCFTSAYLGFRYWWAPRLESLFLSSVVGGLITSVLLELKSLTLSYRDVVYWLDVTMLAALTLVGAARWVWINRREKDRFIKTEQAITDRY